MMKPRSFFYPSILYANFMTLLLCLIGTVGTMLGGPNIPMMRLADSIMILALSFGLFYVLRGARKKDSRYLRTFLLICGAAEFAGLWSTTFIVTWRFLPILAVVRILLYLILAFKHDLGRQFSLLLSISIVFVSIFSLVLVLIGYQRILLGGIIYSSFVGFRSASTLELSIICMICVWFKFQDKEERKRSTLK